MHKNTSIYIRAILFATALGVTMSGPSTIPAQETGPSVGIGIEEKLGDFIPLELEFYDENGDTIQLSDLITRPTILALVYYRCPGICSPLMSGIAEVLDKLDLKPGSDYSVLTVSFDPSETPALAADKKKNYLTAVNDKTFPEEAWRFLVGDSVQIARLTDAVGFRYKKEGKEYLHTAVLTILSPEGKIVRYINGITFLPFEIKMALLEASEGKVGPTISTVLLYCFSYDPQGRKYVFNILKVSGTVILFFAMLFLAFLILGGKKKNLQRRN